VLSRMAQREKAQRAKEEPSQVQTVEPRSEPDGGQEEGALQIDREEQLSEKEHQEAALQKWKVRLGCNLAPDTVN
jgi:hypothetical protein